MALKIEKTFPNFPNAFTTSSIIPVPGGFVLNNA